MNISVEIKNEKQVVKKIMAMVEAGRMSVVGAITQVAVETHAEAIRSVQEIKGSRTQMRYNPRREVRVSDPGKPWNSDTGAGAASIQMEVDDSGAGEARVGSNTKYVAYLEVGTKTMEARPVLMPAFQKAKQILRSVFKFRADLVRNK